MSAFVIFICTFLIMNISIRIWALIPGLIIGFSLSIGAQVAGKLLSTHWGIHL